MSSILNFNSTYHPKIIKSAEEIQKIVDRMHNSKRAKSDVNVYIPNKILSPDALNACFKRLSSTNIDSKQEAKDYFSQFKPSLNKMSIKLANIARRKKLGKWFDYFYQQSNFINKFNDLENEINPKIKFKLKNKNEVTISSYVLPSFFIAVFQQVLLPGESICLNKEMFINLCQSIDNNHQILISSIKSNLDSCNLNKSANCQPIIKSEHKSTRKREKNYELNVNLSNINIKEPNTNKEILSDKSSLCITNSNHLMNIANAFNDSLISTLNDSCQDISSQELNTKKNDTIVSNVIEPKNQKNYTRSLKNDIKCIKQDNFKSSTLCLNRDISSLTHDKNKSVIFKDTVSKEHDQLNKKHKYVKYIELNLANTIKPSLNKFKENKKIKDIIKYDSLGTLIAHTHYKDIMML